MHKLFARRVLPVIAVAALISGLSAMPASATPDDGSSRSTAAAHARLVDAHYPGFGNDPQAGNCDAGYACLWAQDGDGGVGWGAGFWGNEADFRFLPDGYNAIQDNSWWACNNADPRSSYPNVIFYTEANYTGENQLLRPGNCMHLWDRDLADRFSSVKWVR
jgi:hypothetical protein